jgi:hypothetical protein
MDGMGTAYKDDWRLWGGARELIFLDDTAVLAIVLFSLSSLSVFLSFQMTKKTWQQRTETFRHSRCSKQYTAIKIEFREQGKLLNEQWQDY